MASELDLIQEKLKNLGRKDGRSTKMSQQLSLEKGEKIIIGKQSIVLVESGEVSYKGDGVALISSGASKKIGVGELTALMSSVVMIITL